MLKPLQQQSEALLAKTFWRGKGQSHLVNGVLIIFGSELYKSHGTFFNNQPFVGTLGTQTDIVFLCNLCLIRINSARYFAIDFASLSVLTVAGNSNVGTSGKSILID